MKYRVPNHLVMIFTHIDFVLTKPIIALRELVNTISHECSQHKIWPCVGYVTSSSKLKFAEETYVALLALRRRPASLVGVIVHPRPCALWHSQGTILTQGWKRQDNMPLHIHPRAQKCYHAAQRKGKKSLPLKNVQQLRWGYLKLRCRNRQSNFK